MDLDVSLAALGQRDVEVHWLARNDARGLGARLADTARWQAAHELERLAAAASRRKTG